MLGRVYVAIHFKGKAGSSRYIVENLKAKVRYLCQRSCDKKRGETLKRAYDGFEKLGEDNFKLMYSSIVPHNASLKSCQDMKPYFLREQPICLVNLLINRDGPSPLRFDIFVRDHHLDLVEDEVIEFLEQS